MPVITKQFQNLTLPQLGFGSMRLPLLPGGGDEHVDQAAVDRMVDTAMAGGPTTSTPPTATTAENPRW